MKTRVFLDWLSFTVKLNRPWDFIDLWDSVPRWFNTRRALWTNAKPLYGYTVAISMGIGVLAMCHPQKQEMGVHVQLSGQGLELLRMDDATLVKLLTFVENSGGHITRADLAIDAFDSGLNIDSLREMIDLPETIAATKKHMIIATGEGGVTLYVGSESSDRRLRIYNKAAERLSKGIEIGDTSDWVRIELVLRGDKAKAFGSMLCKQNGYLAQIVQQWIKGFCDFVGSEAWCAIMGSNQAVKGVSHRKLTNSQRWLLSTVVKALAKEMVRDESFAERFKERLESELYTAQQENDYKKEPREEHNFTFVGPNPRQW